MTSVPVGLGHPRGAVSHDRRFDDVIAVATKHFRNQGFRGTRLDDISAELGVTRAALYHYFEGKRALLEEICSRAMASSEAALRDVEALDDAHERLLAFAKAYARNMNSDAARVYARDASDLSPEFRRDLRVRAHDINAGATAIFEYGIARGDFRTGLNVRHLTLGFLGMLKSLAEWYRASDDGPFDGAVASVVTLYTRGVAVRSGTLPAEGRS